MPNTPLQAQLINGNRYDFSSIEASVNGRRFLGFKSINYSDSLEPGEVRGTHAQPIGRTRGERKMEASFEVYRQEFDLLQASLSPGFMETPFDLVITYADDGQPVVTDRIIGVRIKKVDKSNSQGTDALTVKVDLHVMDMLHNGKSPVKKPLTATV